MLGGILVLLLKDQNSRFHAKKLVSISGGFSLEWGN
jgi:hypothetical protein